MVVLCILHQEDSFELCRHLEYILFRQQSTFESFLESNKRVKHCTLSHFYGDLCACCNSTCAESCAGKPSSAVRYTATIRPESSAKQPAAAGFDASDSVHSGSAARWAAVAPLRSLQLPRWLACRGRTAVVGWTVGAWQLCRQLGAEGRAQVVAVARQPDTAPAGAACQRIRCVLHAR